MALTVSVTPSTTTDGDISVTIVSSYSSRRYFKFGVKPVDTQYSNRVFENYIALSGSIAGGETYTFTANIPESIRKEWFGVFKGGYLLATTWDYGASDYSGSYTSKNNYFYLYGIHWDGKIGMCLTTLKDNSSSKIFLRDNNSTVIGYTIKGLGNVTNLTYASVPDAIYNLSKTAKVAVNSGNNYVDFTATLGSLFSPNVYIKHYLTYTVPTSGGETSTVTNSLDLNVSVPITEYAAPIVYVDAIQPIATNGRCEVAVAGRFQEYIKTSKNWVEGKYSLEDSNGNYIRQDNVLTMKTQDGGLFSSTITLTGLDYEELYTLTIQVYDMIGVTGKYTTKLISKPMFDWNAEDFNFNVPVYHQENMVMVEGKAIGGITKNYGTKSVFVPQDSTGNTVIGYGNYQSEQGNTLIYGNNVDIIANNDVTINGESFSNPEWKTLWSGQALLDTSISFSSAISDLRYGIQLVFSGVSASGAYQDSSFNTFFVSKRALETLISSGSGTTFLMAINSGLSVFGSKYLGFEDYGIAGHTTNSASGTAASGITFNNARFGLRAVYGL